MTAIAISTSIYLTKKTDEKSITGTLLWIIVLLMVVDVVANLFTSVRSIFQLY